MIRVSKSESESERKGKRKRETHTHGLTFYLLLYILSWCKVNGSLGVAIGHSGISTMAQQQGTHLHSRE